MITSNFESGYLRDAQVSTINAIEHSHVQFSSQSMFVVLLNEPLTATIVLESCQGCDGRSQSLLEDGWCYLDS